MNATAPKLTPIAEFAGRHGVSLQTVRRWVGWLGAKGLRHGGCRGVLLPAVRRGDRVFIDERDYGRFQAEVDRRARGGPAKRGSGVREEKRRRKATEAALRAMGV